MTKDISTDFYYNFIGPIYNNEVLLKFVFKEFINNATYIDNSELEDYLSRRDKFDVLLIYPEVYNILSVIFCINKLLKMKKDISKLKEIKYIKEKINNKKTIVGYSFIFNDDVINIKFHNKEKYDYHKVFKIKEFFSPIKITQ